MNAFPSANNTLLEGYRQLHQHLTDGEFEPGALPLQQRHVSQTAATIRQLEQQAGIISASELSQVGMPLQRRTRLSGTTEVAGVSVPLGTANGEAEQMVDGLADVALDGLDLVGLRKVSTEAGILGAPADESELRTLLYKVVADGGFKPEVVSQRLERNRAIQAILKEEPASVKDSYNDHTLRQVAQFATLPFTSDEPKSIGVKEIREIKKALEKKSELEMVIKSGGVE